MDDAAKKALRTAPPPPLPVNAEEWQKNLKRDLSLNDFVHDLHKRLSDNAKYIGFLRAVYDEQAVEGSLAADNLEAARMIRDEAAKINSPVATEKLATISKALGVVLRRYGLSRKQRRNMIDGADVPSSDDNNSEAS